MAGGTVITGALFWQQVTGWMCSLAVHNRDPNKGAKKPHIRPPIPSNQECWNPKYQTLGNPNICDQMHSKHRSETRSKIPCYKLYSSEDTACLSSLCNKVLNGLMSTQGWRNCYWHCRIYPCLHTQLFLKGFQGKQRTGKASCLSASERRQLPQNSLVNHSFRALTDGKPTSPEQPHGISIFAGWVEGTAITLEVGINTRV